MVRLCAQGDILIERVGEAKVSGDILECVTSGSAIVAAGEATGHHHRVFGTVTLYRDDELARDVPSGLYVGHLQVDSANARIDHDDHAPSPMVQQIYSILRQHHVRPTDTEFHEHYSVLED